MERTGWGRWASVVGGWLLVIAGLAGFVLPVIPGIPLLLGGLALLAGEYVWARRLLERVKGWWEQVRQRKD